MPALPNTVALTALLITALVAYWPSTAALWDFWTQRGYLGEHGLLVGAISVWLAVRSRRALSEAPVQPSLWGCAGLFMCSVASVIFWRAAIQELHVVLLPLILFFAVLAAFGRTVARLVAFPLGFLYLAVPAWHIFTAPLQELTVRAVTAIAPIVGMPARVAGNVLHLPGGVTFEVTPLCSGVNFLVVGLAVAALLGELEGATLRRRFILLVSMACVAVISNWVRVLVIMYAGYASGMQSVVATRGHVLFGWLFFALVLAGFAWLATRSVERTVGIRPYPTRSGSAVGARAAYVTVVGVLIAMPILARALPAALNDGAASLQLTMPAAQNGWRGPVSISEEQWKPTFVGAHSEWRAAYEDSAGDIVEMLAIGYSKQEQDRELVNYCNSLLGEGPCTSSPGGSEHELRALTASSIDRGTHAHVEVLAVDAMGRRFVVWWVYDIGGRMFVTPIYSQLWYGLRSLGGVPPSVLLAYRTACAPSCEAARGRLSRFLESMGGNFVTSQTQPVTATTAGGSPG